MQLKFNYTYTPSEGQPAVNDQIEVDIKLPIVFERDWGSWVASVEKAIMEKHPGVKIVGVGPAQALPGYPI
jgi:hypothetical protein